MRFPPFMKGGLWGIFTPLLNRIAVFIEQGDWAKI